MQDLIAIANNWSALKGERSTNCYEIALKKQSRMPLTGESEVANKNFRL